MSYPGLALDAAKRIDESRRAGIEPPDIEPIALRKPGADLEDSAVIDCLNQCYDLYDTIEDAGASHAEFDSQCAPLIHRTLNLSARVAGDPDFWRWLTFVQGCYGAEIVDRRYGKHPSDDERQLARPVYFGLGLMKKGMFAKLWICANAMYVEGESNPYDGIEYADVDLWDSHVVDVDYGSSPAVARAFVKIVRDMNLPRGEPNNPDGAAGFRDLAKEIRRRQATVALELFGDSAARKWVEDIWGERELWRRRL